MPDQNFDAPEISPFKRDQLNPFYLLAKLLYTEPGKKYLYKKEDCKRNYRNFKGRVSHRY